MNKKGFTLIELLATITILALIMLVAVPNVMSTIDKNTKRTYVEDAKKMITLVEYRFRSDVSIPKPETGKCIVVLISSLDDVELSDSPEGGEYRFDSSYVVIANKAGTYEYSVTLVERYDEDSYKGLRLVTRDMLNEEGALNRVEEFPASPVIPTVGSNLNGSVVQTVVS